MDFAILPNEITRSIAKLDKADLRSETSTGWGATTGGMALTQRYHERLTEGVRLALLEGRRGKASDAILAPMLNGTLSPSVIALSALQTVLHSIGSQETLRDTLVRLGSNLADECWAAKLTKCSPQIARRIERAAKIKHAAVPLRYAKVRRAVDSIQSDEPRKKPRTDAQLADKALLENFKERIWSRKARTIAGGWLWNIVSSSLPEVFERVIVEGTTEYALTIADDAWAVVDQALLHAVDTHPVFWPETIAPKAWEAYTGGGAHDERVNGNVAVLRSNHKDTQSAVKHAIKTGQMQPALDALNSLQSVAYTVNREVLAVIQECEGYQLKVKGIVPQNLEVPEKPNAFAWEAMDEAQQRYAKLKRSAVKKANRGFIGDRILFATDMATAEDMSKSEAFYTAMNLDWRGRVYALSHFNFQREDRVRALFNFAEGLPIGEDGLWYLKVHTANCGDFNKVSKRPLQERVQWCNDNTQLITNIASAPLAHTEWMKADKPFLFLAACFELSKALAQGSSFITHLPLSFDGSCSGLQHLCAMTRAAEGSMVNLTPSLIPQDVYQRVADAVVLRLELDLTNAPDADAKDPEKAVKASKDTRAMAALFLDYFNTTGDRRKGAKRNVMTYSYSSRKFGMAAQQQEDMMEPLAREVLEGKRTEHPFEGYQHGPWSKDGQQQPSKAARYIAGHVFDAIEACIHKPAEAMKFLQGIAKTMAHEGKPVQWTTPVGIPWINRYHEKVLDSVSLYLNDKGIKERVRVLIATGSKREIDKDKSANGVAPNFVHALDAAHLLRVVNASNLEGIRSIATVHDSFGCLAPQARRFNAIIREQFALMYETHDVLSEILERATTDLSEANRDRLPPQPAQGPLDLKDILNADFAFA